MNSGQLHLFLIWSLGRSQEQEILDDLARRFELLDVVEISWPPASFSNNLTRFYGESLPPGSGKERHCGAGPFLVAVVRDTTPIYVLERHGGRRRVVNRNATDAKACYRDWTGGGHRVHASVHRAEFEHDLFLLLGRLPVDYAAAPNWSGTIDRVRAQLRGGEGWTDLDELARALRVALRSVRIVRDADRVSVLSRDPWWAAVIANGRPGLDDPAARRHEVTIGGAPITLDLSSLDSEPPSPGRARSLARRARAAVRMSRLRWSPRRRGLALVYHTIAEEHGDPRLELVPALSVEQLGDQVSHLARWCRLVNASALPAAIAQRRLGQRLPVALTFDDDLRSHLEIAAPVLRAAGVPATFFLGGASLEAPFSFWWEDLQELIDLGKLASAAAPVAAGDLEAAVNGGREGLQQLARTIERLPAGEREQTVAPALRAARGPIAPSGGLDREAVAALGREFEIGFHTRDHHLLPALTDDQLTAALEVGRAELVAVTGRPLEVIAYPHGKADERVARAAAAAGYVAGYAGSPGPADAGSDTLLLPRNELRTSGADFAAALAWLLTR